jgi:hypothetical protein
MPRSGSLSRVIVPARVGTCRRSKHAPQRVPESILKEPIERRMRTQRAAAALVATHLAAQWRASRARYAQKFRSVRLSHGSKSYRQQQLRQAVR